MRSSRAPVFEVAVNNTTPKNHLSPQQNEGWKNSSRAVALMEHGTVVGIIVVVGALAFGALCWCMWSCVVGLAGGSPRAYPTQVELSSRNIESA